MTGRLIPSTLTLTSDPTVTHDIWLIVPAVRADRMRGGRNKFGPMYKRDRARKLQMMRQRQMAVQTLRGTLGGDGGVLGLGGYGGYPSLPIKQEIQIPQVSSLTSSPDSSPSPAALGAPAPLTVLPALPPAPPPDKPYYGPNSTTRSPHSVSPESFSFEGSAASTTTPDAGAAPEPLRVSPMIREFVQSIDDREWQNSLFGLLQSQTYNQCEVDLFELMCKVLDQNLFSQVDWARNTVFFKDLKVSVGRPPPIMSISYLLLHIFLLRFIVSICVCSDCVFRPGAN